MTIDNISVYSLHITQQPTDQPFIFPMSNLDPNDPPTYSSDEASFEITFNNLYPNAPTIGGFVDVRIVSTTIGNIVQENSFQDIYHFETCD